MVYGESVRFVYLIPSILLLLGLVTAAIIALTARSRFPRRASLGAGGFALMALASLFSVGLSLASSALISGDNYELYSTLSTVTSIVSRLLELTGIALLLLALFKKEDTEGGGQPQYGGQYPGQQYPAQQWPQPGQQYPPQYPGQQYPPQYPGQQYPRY